MSYTAPLQALKSRLRCGWCSPACFPCCGNNASDRSPSASAEMRRDAPSSPDTRGGSHCRASWARAGSFLPPAAPPSIGRRWPSGEGGSRCPPTPGRGGGRVPPSCVFVRVRARLGAISALLLLFGRLWPGMSRSDRVGRASSGPTYRCSGGRVQSPGVVVGRRCLPASLGPGSGLR